eukprot:s2812_g5.t1
MVSFSPDSMRRSMEHLVDSLDHKLGGHRSEASVASNMSLDTILSKRAISHASVRTSTTESSLYLQGRTKEGDHDEIGPFINEEKFQAERIVAQRGQRERDRRQFLQEDRGIRGICYRLMQNQGIKALSHIVAFLTFVLVIVLANAAADMLSFPEDQEKIRSYRQLEVLMTVLISIYIVEVIISFIGCPITPRIYDGWLVLDVFIASIAFVDEFVLGHFHSLGIMRTTRAVRLLRILRVGRICRLFEMVRNFPLIAMVLIETSIRLAWMFAIWSIIGWCAAAIITVIVGAEGFSELPDIEDPLVQAIIDAGPSYPMQPEVVLRGLGGTLLLMSVMPMRLIYWGPSIWKLLTVQNYRLNAAGVCLVLYSALCVVWIWPMVVGCFISVLREGQNRIQRNKVKALRKMQQFSVEDLVQVFEDVVTDSPDRFISLDDFREMQHSYPTFAKLVSGGPGVAGTNSHIADAIFRGFDIMNLNFLTLPDFVLGVLKLLRVLPKPEFSTMDEQQRRALRNFSKASGGNRFSFLVTSRYLNEFRSELRDFVASSSKVINAEVRSVDSMGLARQLPAVSDQEEKQLRSSFMARMQEKYDFRQRLLHAEESLKYLSHRQQQDIVQESFKKVAEAILHEDIMPMLAEQMPTYLELQKLQRKAEKDYQVQREVRIQASKQAAPVAQPVLSGAAPDLSTAPGATLATSTGTFRLSSRPASSIFYSST